MSRWLVEVRVTSLHARIVEASSAEEARLTAERLGWNDDTLNVVERIGPYGAPIEEDEEEGEE